MSFGLYSAGFAIVIAGLIYGAHLMHIPTRWIVVGAVVLLGVGNSDLVLRRPVRNILRIAIAGLANLICRIRQVQTPADTRVA